MNRDKIINSLCVLVFVCLLLTWGILVELSNISKELRFMREDIKESLNNISFSINPQRAFLGNELYGDYVSSLQNLSAVRQIRKSLKPASIKDFVDSFNENTERNMKSLDNN